MARLAVLERSFPTIVAPYRWIRRSRLRIVVAALVMLAVVLGPPLWWTTQLIGLPDIGDPFDEAAFRALTIPDDQNAYRLYERAWQKYQPVDRFYKPARNIRPAKDARWPVAAPEIRQWADANRDALALYRQASELSDAMPRPPRSENQPDERGDRSLGLGPFQELALLEASRLEASGDMAGGWGWYRANLRTAHLVSRHAGVGWRVQAVRWRQTLLARAADWAADRKTTPDLIRRAIDDVIACEEISPSESYTLKAEYLDLKRELNNFDGPRQQTPGFARAIVSFLPVDLGTDQKLAAYQTRRLLLHEPQRSQRVIRLAVANWLAYYDLPESERPGSGATADGGVSFFYPPTPQAPSNAKLISPQALAHWLGTCVDAQSLLSNWQLTAARRGEKTNYREFLLALAEELYRRDHGAEPPNPEALVGPYLKTLPPEFPEIRDESLPVLDVTRE